jgi:hypothetical protein
VTSRFPLAEGLKEGGFAPDLVVSKPDAPRGRGRKIYDSEVKLAAQELGLPCQQPADPHAAEFLAELRKLRPDVGVVVSYGRDHETRVAAAAAEEAHQLRTRRCCRSTAARRRSSARSARQEGDPASRSSASSSSSTLATSCSEPHADRAEPRTRRAAARARRALGTGVGGGARS